MFHVNLCSNNTYTQTNTHTHKRDSHQNVYTKCYKVKKPILFCSLSASQFYVVVSVCCAQKLVKTQNFSSNTGEGTKRLN